MTNNEAINRIREHMIIHKYKEPYAIKISEALEMSIAALENQKNWNLCNDVHPKSLDSYLLTVKDNTTEKFDVTVGWYVGNGCWVCLAENITPIAWMEFPEPFEYAEK